MIMHKENPFTKEEVNINEEKIVDRINKESTKSVALRNKNRKSIHYPPNQLVFLKLHHQDKVEDKYTGPFKIIEISNDSNRVQIDQINKLSWENIKNLRPFFSEGQDDVTTSLNHQ